MTYDEVSEALLEADWGSVTLDLPEGALDCAVVEFASTRGNPLSLWGQPDSLAVTVKGAGESRAFLVPFSQIGALE